MFKWLSRYRFVIFLIIFNVPSFLYIRKGIKKCYRAKIEIGPSCFGKNNWNIQEYTKMVWKGQQLRICQRFQKPEFFIENISSVKFWTPYIIDSNIPLWYFSLLYFISESIWSVVWIFMKYSYKFYYLL